MNYLETVQKMAEEVRKAFEAIERILTRTDSAPELEETRPRPKPPYQVFFVRTVPAHPIPWYTSGFQ